MATKYIDADLEMVAINRLLLLYGLILSLLLLTACSTATNYAVGETRKIDKKALADINLQLAVAYLERGHMSRAKEKLLMAQHQAPKDSVVWYTTGYFYEKTGDIAEADKAYTHAIKLAPKSGSSENNYGTFLCRQGRYQQAIQYFMLAIADPSYLDTAYAYENAGLCALKIPNKKLAMQYFQQALKHNPNLPKSLLEMTRINYEQRNYKAAKENLARYHALAQPNSLSVLLEKKLIRAH